MLDLAEVRAGSRVLDIAAGDGGQSLQAAERVGAEGYVLATDISSQLLALAEQSAQALRLTNFATRVMDARTLELDDASFDAVISRLGLMLIPEPQRVLGEIRRVLRPGGCLAALVFSTPDRSPWLSRPMQAAMQHAGRPARRPGEPGLFSLGAPGVFEAALREAGFRDIEVRYGRWTLEMASARQCPLAQAREVLEFNAEFSESASDDVNAAPVITTGPDGSGLIVMDVTYTGDPAAGERELAPLRGFGTPLADQLGLVPYVGLQTKFDAASRPGVRSYVKSGMVRELTPGFIAALIESFEPGGGVDIFFHAGGGAVSRIGETATAWPHRRPASMVVPVSFWNEAAQDAERIQAVRNVWAALEPHTGGYYENIQSETNEAQSNFGPVFGRLSALKKSHDPMNLFRLNSNIRPVA